jgi:LmbE family N-acetylglucosaminyl deacetylase
MKNEKNTVHIVSDNYLSFVLMHQRKRIALLNIDAEECTLYKFQSDAFFNPWLKGFSDKKLDLKLRKDAGCWQIVSNREVLVNGVGWRKRILKDGDKIYLGEYRLVFEGNFQEDIPSDPVIPLVPKNQKKLVRLIEAAAVIMSVSFLWYCTSLSHDTKIVPEISSDITIGHESEFPYGYSEELDELDSVPSLAGKDIVDSSLTVYRPGEEPSPQKLDILFIHAHPDDESLDYGLYMAQAAAEGKSTGIIVFTDGDSGFDKYPDRPVDGFYPDSYLKGSNLARVRVREAENALSILGAKVYVRLGLWNRPYTAVEVLKNVAEISSEWGGEELLIQKLVSLMETFRPDVIVSPDGPCDAREHFEHEAVGFLSDAAVRIYIQKNPEQLKVYLKLVDVQQSDAYPGMSFLRIDTDMDNSYFDVKRAALMMHQSQADSSYYGLKRLADFPFEHYLVEYRSGDTVGSEIALLNSNVMYSLPEKTF